MPSRRPAPMPLTRWQETWRILLASMFGLLFWTVQFAGSVPIPAVVRLLDLALGTGCIVLMHWRRRWPVGVAVATTLATAVSAMGAGASVIALISLVTTRRWRPIIGVTLLGIATGLIFDRVYPQAEEQLPWWALILFSALVSGIAIAIGLYIGARRELIDSYRERAETAEREQASRVAQARTNERAQIAREMHDVLAHRISLVAMHAGAMTYRTDLTREELVGAAQVVQDNAHRALTDLRDVLGVLREVPVGSPRPPERPQPTLADLGELLDDARDAGTRVDVREELADPAALPQTVGRTAYRIIQEALTNARKHAPGSPVALRLSGAPGSRVDIEVRNPLSLRPGGRPDGRLDVPGAGMGMIGLVERAALAGGQLTHGATSGQEYVVHAWLPWAP